MEGSPVREQSRWRNAWIREALDAETFRSEVVRLIAGELRHAEVIFGIVEPSSGALELPSWMKTHLERHPTLYKKLALGERVGINHTVHPSGPRPAGAIRSSVLLFPVISEGVLYGAIGLVSRMDGPPLLQDDLEMVRQIANQAGPVFSRLSELERLRCENRQLRGLVEMRSHMQANVAHELRTPLAAVRGYTRMILDGRAGGINDTQKEFLRVVGDNSTRLINLVGWMTHVIEISSEDFELSRFDLRNVWSDCTREEVGLKITDRSPEEPFEVAGDRRKLARVFDRLVAALQRLSTAESNIVVEFSHGRDRETTVKVSDAGAIVPPELLTRIFDRSFSSVPMPLTSGVEGGELGLSDIYDIVGMHGGRFFVNSRIGHGVTFLFTLPAVELDGEEKVSHEQAVNSGR